MKKTIVLLGLLLSICSFSTEECAYEEVPIAQAPENIKVVKILKGEETGLYGIVDSSGKFLTKGNNILISIQKNHIYIVDIDNNEGLMSTEGKWIGKMGEYRYKDKYANMYIASSETKDKRYFIVYNKENNQNKFGFLDIDGNLCVPIIYDEAEMFSDGLAAVKKDGKWGYVNTKGIEVIPFEYDEALDFKNGEALVRIGNETFYIDKYGKEKLFSTLLSDFQDWIEKIKKHIASSFEEKVGTI